jgi:hypothetical protein
LERREGRRRASSGERGWDDRFLDLGLRLEVGVSRLAVDGLGGVRRCDGVGAIDVELAGSAHEELRDGLD